MTDGEGFPTSPEQGEASVTLDDAIELAKEAHSGQEDKGEDRPYFDHCFRVMEALEPYGENAQMVGVLHDALEDTWVTTEDLQEQGYPEEVIEAILSVSKSEKDDSYGDLIRRAKANPIGRVVKLADNLDNSLEARLANFPDDKADYFRDKYADARKILLDDDEWLQEQHPQIKTHIKSLYEPVQ